MKNAKKWFNSKTVRAGAATVLSGLALLLTGEATAQEFVITIVGVVFTVLRFVTAQPISFE
tara:strand:- start:1378 stop:1560 length:183 start_codon:yes stop_codon:yes gene_type:complete